MNNTNQADSPEGSLLQSATSAISPSIALQDRRDQTRWHLQAFRHYAWGHARRERGLYRLGHATDFRQSLIMGLEIAVGQIQSRDVHTRDDHFAKGVRIITGGTNSGDYLGLSESVSRSQR